MEPRLLPRGDGYLFMARHRSLGPPRARVLLCPPLLQEQVRSFRFLAQLAGQWARHGVETIRFDYLGSGDSSGSTREFTVEHAIADIRHVWDATVRREDGIPQVICGVRMGCLLAAHAIRDGLDADLAWWWQPVASGGEWLDEMTVIDARERSSRSRFPLQAAAEAVEGELMGHAIDSRLPADLRTMAWPRIATPSTWLLDGLHGPPPHAAPEDVVRLPLAFEAWPDQVDFKTIIPVRHADAITAQLLVRLGEATACKRDVPMQEWAT